MFCSPMSDEYRVLRLHPLSDNEVAEAKLQETADDGFEWVAVVPSVDAALVIMKRRKRTTKSDASNPYYRKSNGPTAV
jgi:hypothetical protein